MRVRIATIFPASSRKRCSTTWKTSPGGGSPAAVTFSTLSLPIGSAGGLPGCLGNSFSQFASRGGFDTALCQRAGVRDLAHSDERAVIEGGTLLGDGQRFFHCIHAQHEITANGFLGLGKWPVGDDPALLAGNDLACGFERVAAFTFAFLRQAFEPIPPLTHDGLDLLRGKAFVPINSAEKQQVMIGCFVFFVITHMIFSFLLSVLPVQRYDERPLPFRTIIFCQGSTLDGPV